MSQLRSAIIRDNLSTPIRPRSAKAPKPLIQQAHGSAKERTYSAPTDMGSHGPRFNDPVGAVFSAYLQFDLKRRYDPLWVGFPGTDDCQPDGDEYLIDARMQDAKRQYAIVCEACLDKTYPKTPELSVPEAWTGGLTKTGTYDPWPPAYPQALPMFPYAPFQNAMTPTKVTAISLPRASGEPYRCWDSPRANPAKLTVTLVKTTILPDGGELVDVTVKPWVAKTRKSLFNRIPIQSRSAKKRGTRLVSRLPADTRLVLAVAGLKS